MAGPYPNDQGDPRGAMPVYNGAGVGPSLTAVDAPVDGSVIRFNGARANVAMQVSFTGTPSAVLVDLLGTIDGVHFVKIATFSTAAGNVSGDIISSNGVPVIAVKAALTTLTGGSSPTVSASISAV